MLIKILQNQIYFYIIVPERRIIFLGTIFLQIINKYCYKNNKTFLKKEGKKVKRKLILIFPLLVLLVLIFGCFFYVNDFYHSEESVQSYLQSKDQVTVKKIAQGYYLDGMGEEEAFIFYPGAKVEYTAYLPLLYQLAEQGVDCFLVEMPFRLAFLGQNKAETIRNEYEYPHWYLAGHSLGGAMAASYAAKHLKELDGLVLLAAYPTKSLQEESFSVVSVYGSEDGVLNMEKLKEGRRWMPFDYTELCIEGGNHAGFGNYGEQKGDKTAFISKEEQQQQTCEVILEMIQKKEEK